MFTRKHYIAIADCIRLANAEATLGHRPTKDIASLADKLARFFLTDNPRFSYYRFLRACEVNTTEQAESTR